MSNALTKKKAPNPQNDKLKSIQPLDNPVAAAPMDNLAPSTNMAVTNAPSLVPPAPAPTAAKPAAPSLIAQPGTVDTSKTQRDPNIERWIYPRNKDGSIDKNSNVPVRENPLWAEAQMAARLNRNQGAFNNFLNQEDSYTQGKIKDITPPRFTADHNAQESANSISMNKEVAMLAKIFNQRKSAISSAKAAPGLAQTRNL